MHELTARVETLERILLENRGSDGKSSVDELEARVETLVNCWPTIQADAITFKSIIYLGWID